MIFFKRILVFLVPFCVFLTFEYFFKNPISIYGVIAWLIVIISLAIWKLTQKELIAPASAWDFLISPIILVLSALFFSIFLETAISRHILALLVTLFLGIFLEIAFTYIYFHQNYQVYSLENVSGYFNLLSFFLACSSLFSLAMFLGVPTWQFTIYIILISFLLLFEDFWINKTLKETKWLFIFSLTLIIAEVAWVLSFFPFNFYTNSLILTLFYYALSELSLAYFKGQLDKAHIKRCLLIGFLGVVLAMFTAGWR